jgi:hypothetical protein
MNKPLKFAVAALLVGGVSLAAPMFAFSTSNTANAMMKADTINLSAYPKLKLLAKDIMGARATLTYTGTDAKGVFNFYEAAFKKEGWKVGAAMVAKPGDTMSKPAGTMDKPGEAMMGSKPLEGTYALGGHTLETTVNAKDGKTVAQFSVK